jgi:type II secretory pathway component PulC
MFKRSTVIVSFVLCTLLSIGSVESFCRYLNSVLVEKSKMVTTKKAGLQQVRHKLTVSRNKLDRNTKGENYTIIKRRGLFGKEVSEKVSKKIAVKDAPPLLKMTSMDLTLLGTVTGAANVQMAIIKDKKRKTQDIYYKDDTVGGAVIKEVRRGEIVLSIRGKDEILIMGAFKSSPEKAVLEPLAMAQSYTRQKPMARRIYEQPPSLESEGVVLGGDDPEAFFAPPPYVPPLEQVAHGNSDSDVISTE